MDLGRAELRYFHAVAKLLWSVSPQVLCYTSSPMMGLTSSLTATWRSWSCPSWWTAHGRASGSVTSSCWPMRTPWTGMRIIHLPWERNIHKVRALHSVPHTPSHKERTHSQIVFLQEEMLAHEPWFVCSVWARCCWRQDAWLVRTDSSTHCTFPSVSPSTSAFSRLLSEGIFFALHSHNHPVCWDSALPKGNAINPSEENRHLK